MEIKNPITLVAAVGGMLVAGWFFYGHRESEPDRIRQRLHELADIVSTTNQEKGTARLKHFAELRQFFTEGVSVQITEGLPTVTGRDTLLQMAHVALQQEPNLTVAFADISVAHEDGRQDAQVNTTVLVTGVHSDKARSVDAQELEIALVKAEGEWLIEAIRSVKVMVLQ